MLIFDFAYGNINICNAKNHTQNLMGGGWFNRELKILALFLGFISFSNLIFSNNTFALFTPTLSASVDQANLQVNGNQVINSTDKTTEIPLNLTVNTNNKTGYTATLSSETENTALTNATSTAGAKINSISSTGSLGDFSNDTWGYKFGASTNYAPIPALSTPAQILQTTGKTNGNESNLLSIGMKLADNLESGNYTNKLILSFVSNPYTPIAIMTEGPDFNAKLKSLGAFEHFKKSTVAPATSTNAKNIEDESSDCEIKLWLDPADKTAYYYAEPEKVYLNTDSSKMFYDMRNFTILNLPNFDTSKVTNMQYMFSDMTKLTTLDLSNFDTSKVTDMKYMFNEMYSLTSLNLSSFNTSNVTDMSCMFAHMFRLTSLNLSNFDTSKVTNMGAMFYDMPSLTSLDLSNFNTSNVTNMGWVFAFNGSEKIYVNNDFNTSKLTNFSNMFKESKKLRGGNGSYLADPSTADKTWLRVDRPGVHGYFTRKP